MKELKEKIIHILSGTISFQVAAEEIKKMYDSQLCNNCKYGKVMEDEVHLYCKKHNREIGGFVTSFLKCSSWGEK